MVAHGGLSGSVAAVIYDHHDIGAETQLPDCDQPLLAIAIAIVFAMIVSVLVDIIIRRFLNRGPVISPGITGDPA